MIEKILRERNQYGFLERSVLLKKRISFFGIFSASDNLEIITAQYDFLKSQFNKVCQQLTKFENVLVKTANQDKKKGEAKDPHFSLVAKKN